MYIIYYKPELIKNLLSLYSSFLHIILQFILYNCTINFNEYYRELNGMVINLGIFLVQYSLFISNINKN